MRSSLKGHRNFQIVYPLKFFSEVVIPGSPRMEDPTECSMPGKPGVVVLLTVCVSELCFLLIGGTQAEPRYNLWVKITSNDGSFLIYFFYGSL